MGEMYERYKSCDTYKGEWLSFFYFLRDDFWDFVKVIPFLALIIDLAILLIFRSVPGTPTIFREADISFGITLIGLIWLFSNFSAFLKELLKKHCFINQVMALACFLLVAIFVK